MHSSNNPKIVFVAIPKTGTRSVVDYIEKYCNARKAPGTRTHSATIPTQLRNHYAFTIVRDPFDRLASYWWSTCMRPRGSKISFERFLNSSEGHQHQHTFLNNKFNKIIRYENLEEEFSKLPFFVKGTSLAWLNSTIQEWNGLFARPATVDLMTPKIQKIIVRKFKRDFELLKYPKTYQQDISNEQES